HSPPEATTSAKRCPACSLAGEMNGLHSTSIRFLLRTLNAMERGGSLQSRTAPRQATAMPSVQTPEGALVVGGEAGPRRRGRRSQRLELIARPVRRPGRLVGRVGIAAASEPRPVTDHGVGEILLRRSESRVRDRRAGQVEDVCELRRVVGTGWEAYGREVKHRRAGVVELVLVCRNELRQ